MSRRSDLHSLIERWRVSLILAALTALVGLIGGLTLAITDPRGDDSASANSIKVQTISTKMYNSGTLVDLRVASPEVDYPMRDIYTWTPPLTNQDPQTLPVVYFLHGWPGSPSSMIAAVTPQLLKNFRNGVRPFIAAFPDGNAKTHIDSEWADSSDGKAMVETWLTTNAITAVEGDRIRSRDERAIVGFSMGGYGAAMIALHHPDLYSQVTTLAGYFIVDDLTGAFKGSAKISFQSPNNFMGAAQKLRWYLAEARDDFTTPIHGELARWSKKLTSLKIPMKTDSPTGGHSFVFVGNEALLFSKWFTWPVPVPVPVPIPTTSVASPTTSPSAAMPTEPAQSPSATPSLSAAS